jgi:hypothetical protein
MVFLLFGFIQPGFKFFYFRDQPGTGPGKRVPVQPGKNPAVLYGPEAGGQGPAAEISR